MKRPTRGALGVSAAAIAALLCLWGAPAASAQSDNAPPTSRGENFSNKPAPALFQADCTGGGCHKGPQGLAKGQSQGSLAGFLREHYTNSRESAASLSAYLLKLPPAPAQPSPRAASTRETPPSAPARSGPSWFDPEQPSRQQQQQQGARPARAAARPGEDAAPTPPAAVPSAPAAAEPSSRQQQQQGARPARAAARSGEDAAPTPPAAVPSAPAAAEPPARPAREPRNQRGRQQPTAAAAAPPAAEAAPPSPPPAPPPPQWDIFD